MYLNSVYCESLCVFEQLRFLCIEVMLYPSIQHSCAWTQSIWHCGNGTRSI